MQHAWLPSERRAGAGAGSTVVGEVGSSVPSVRRRGLHAIRSVDVEFPFVPYESQKAFLSKLLETLQSAQNALLESPTGTGKVRSRWWGGRALRQ